jgi:hypothetical protein
LGHSGEADGGPRRSRRLVIASEAPATAARLRVRALTRFLDLSMGPGERLVILEHMDAARAEVLFQIVAITARPLDANGLLWAECQAKIDE